MQVDAAAVLETVSHLVACLLTDTPGTTLNCPVCGMHCICLMQVLHAKCCFISAVILDVLSSV